MCTACMITLCPTRLLSHFKNHSFNVSEDMINAGIEEHTGMALSYMEDKIAINKSNFFLKLHSFYEQHMKEVFEDAAVEDVVTDA